MVLVPPKEWLAAVARNREVLRCRVDIDAPGIDMPATAPSFNTELAHKWLDRPLMTALVEPALKEYARQAAGTAGALAAGAARADEVSITIGGVGTIDGLSHARTLLGEQVTIPSDSFSKSRRMRMTCAAHRPPN